MKGRLPRIRVCAARYSTEDRTLKLEKKEQIKERLGRSPDLVDAVVMAFWEDRGHELADLYRRPLELRICSW